MICYESVTQNPEKECPMKKPSNSWEAKFSQLNYLQGLTDTAVYDNTT